MTTPRVPSAEEILNGGHWLCITDKQRIERLRAYVHIVLEAAAEVVQRREVENGTAAEGEEEPWFSIHTHTEAQLHNAVGDIRALKEDL